MEYLEIRPKTFRVWHDQRMVDGVEAPHDELFCGTEAQLRAEMHGRVDPKSPNPFPETAGDKLNRALSPTESPSRLARTLEEVLDHLEHGAPVSAQTKAWLTERKRLRN